MIQLIEISFIDFPRIPCFLNIILPQISGMGCAAIALTFAHYLTDLFMDEDEPGFTVAKKSAATLAIG